MRGDGKVRYSRCYDFVIIRAIAFEAASAGRVCYLEDVDWESAASTPEPATRRTAGRWAALSDHSAVGKGPTDSLT